MSPTRRSASRLGILLAALSALPAAATAQRVERFVPIPASHSIQVEPDGGPSAAGVFLASAVAPGAGQYRLGAGRWVAYAAVEAWAWIDRVKRHFANRDGAAYLIAEALNERGMTVAGIRLGWEIDRARARAGTRADSRDALAQSGVRRQASGYRDSKWTRRERERPARWL